MNSPFVSQINETKPEPSKPLVPVRSRKSRFASGIRRGIGATLGALFGIYVVAMNTSPQITPPVRPMLPKQNGFPMLRDATRQLFQDEAVADAIAKKPQKKRTREEREALVVANYVPLEKAREALRYPYQEELSHTSFYGETPYYPQFRKMARLFVLAGNVAWEEGKQKEAADDYLNGVTMGRHIPHHVGLFGSLVGIASEGIARRPLWDRRDQMNEETATYVLARLEQLKTERLPYAETMAEERYIELTGTKIAMEHPEKFAEFIEKDSKADRILRVYDRLVPRKYVIDTMSAHLDKVVAQSRKPYISDHGELPLPNEIFTRIMTPVLCRARCMSVASEAGDALLRTALALRIYQLRHGEYPERLSDLVETKIIDQIPEDPFALPGISVRYARQTSGKYLLYSIGPDGIDNKGTVIDNYPQYSSSGSKRVAQEDSKGDIVAGAYAY